MAGSSHTSKPGPRTVVVRATVAAGAAALSPCGGGAARTLGLKTWRRQGDFLPALPTVVRGEQRRALARNIPRALCQRPSVQGRRHLYLDQAAAVAQRRIGKVGERHDRWQYRPGTFDQPGARVGLRHRPSGRLGHCVALRRLPGAAGLCSTAVPGLVLAYHSTTCPSPPRTSRGSTMALLLRATTGG